MISDHCLWILFIASSHENFRFGVEFCAQSLSWTNVIFSPFPLLTTSSIKWEFIPWLRQERGGGDWLGFPRKKAWNRCILEGTARVYTTANSKAMSHSLCVCFSKKRNGFFLLCSACSRKRPPPQVWISVLASQMPRPFFQFACHKNWAHCVSPLRQNSKSSVAPLRPNLFYVA